MFKPILIVCIWTTVFFLGEAPGWTTQEDLETHFIDPDLDTSKTIFLDVKEVSLINVLKIISKQTGLSFIANHDVEDKKITVYLNKIPLNQALTIILDANDLTYEMQDNTDVFVIKEKLQAEKAKITRVYQLKYATVSASKLNSTISTSGGGGGGKAGSGGLEEVLQDSLSKDGKVVEDTRTNSLIVTDVPAQFPLIESTITKLDVPIPQILIEVEMLDVSKSTADQLGVSYGTTPLVFTGGIKSYNFPFGPTAAGSSSTTSSSNTSTGWNANGMTATLNALATSTDSHTLARPRILTLNNETASIEISSDTALSVNQTISSTGGSSSNTVTGNTVERYTTGVILKVTPQANLVTREVTMAVSPKVTDVSASQISASVYNPETTGSDSILKLKDGQTMIIGGLMRNQETKTINKVPFFGDLPFIGTAFRSVNKTKTDRELIIFLTPHIIDDVDQSALKGDISANAAQGHENPQDADSRAREIDNSLNVYGQ